MLLLFLPPTTIIASTSAASTTESAWRVRVTGQTVLTTRRSWQRRRQKAANSSSLNGQDGRLRQHADLLGVRHTLPGRAVHVVDHDVVVAGVRAHALHLGMVLVADDADRVARLGQLARRLLGLQDPGAGSVDDLEVRPCRAPVRSRAGTPWARMTSVPPSTWSARSAVRMPRSERSALMPGLWTSWPSVVTSLPSSRACFALSIASRTP